MSATVISYGVKPGAAGARVDLRTGAPAGPVPSHGSAAFLGAFPWGPPASWYTPGVAGSKDAVMVHPDAGQFERWAGPYSFEEEAALAVTEFYEESEGQAIAATCRVLDGNELTAEAPVFNRDAEPGMVLRTPPAKRLTQVGSLKGAFPGERGGAEANLVGYVANVVTAISAATFNTGQSAIAWPVNRWKGATFAIVGDTATYLVLASSAAGVLTLDRNVVTTLTGAQNWYLYLPGLRFPELSGFAEPLNVGAWIRQNQDEPTSAFDLECFRDSMSPDVVFERMEWSADRNPETITQEARDLTRSNPWIDFDNIFDASGLDNQERHLPAAWAGVPMYSQTGDVSGTYEFQWWEWARNTASNDGKGPFPSSVVGVNGNLPCTVLCTFTGAGVFDVTITDQNGGTLAFDLPAGADDVEYDTGSPYIPKFTLTEGETASQADDTITFYFRPLPALSPAPANTYIFPFAFTETGTGSKDSTTAYRVIKTTFESVTVVPASKTAADADVTKPLVASVEGSVAPTYNLGTNPTFIWYDAPDATGVPTAARTITDTSGAVAATAADLVLEYNARIALEYGTDPEEIEFYVATSGKIGIRSTLSAGSSAGFYVGAGTLNPLIGVANATAHAGTDGAIVRLELPISCTHGFDGHHSLTETDIETALNPASSPLDPLAAQDLGHVRLAVPGYASSTINPAADRYAFANGYMSVLELPRTVTTEAAARAWVKANTTASRTSFHIMSPHHVRSVLPYKPNPTVQASALGAFLGAKARRDNANKGPHIPFANYPEGKINKIRRVPLAGAGGWTPDDSILTRAGIVPIMQVGNDVYAFGDEGRDIGGGTYWIHKMETILHIGRLLYGLAAQFAYKPIPSVWQEIDLYAKQKLRPLHSAGAFKAPSFEDAVSVTVGKTNNPEIVQNAGKVIADIRIRGIIDAAKEVTFVVTSDTVAVAIL
jgi:hypothetical protein